MTKVDRTPKKLVLRSGATTLTLDKDAGTALMQRKFMFWNLKPMETPLAEIAEIAVDAGVDRASGVEACNTMLVTKAGAAWALPAADKKDAQDTAATMREFLGLKG